MSPVDEAAIAEAFGALSHPVRIRVLRLAEDGVKLSASSVQRTLTDVSLGTMAYHVRQLAGAGVLKKAGRVQHRGALEQLYLLSPKGIKLARAIEDMDELLSG